MLGAFAVHFPLLEFTLVARLIRPYHRAFSLHIIIFEFALIHFPRVSEVVLAVTMKLSVDEIALIVAAFELKASMTALLAIHELSNIFDLIVTPALSAVPMLLVVNPFALVHASIGVHEYAVTVCFSILPHTLINVIVRMSHSSFALKQLILCHSLVLRAIRKQ